MTISGKMLSFVAFMAAISPTVCPLIDEPRNWDRRAEIRQRAPLVLEQFSTATISREWSDFLWEGLPKPLEKVGAPRPACYHYASSAGGAALTNAGRA